MSLFLFPCCNGHCQTAQEAVAPQEDELVHACHKIVGVMTITACTPWRWSAPLGPLTTSYVELAFLTRIPRGATRSFGLSSVLSFSPPVSRSSNWSFVGVLTAGMEICRVTCGALLVVQGKYSFEVALLLPTLLSILHMEFSASAGPSSVPCRISEHSWTVLFCPVFSARNVQITGCFPGHHHQGFFAEKGSPCSLPAP